MHCVTNHNASTVKDCWGVTLQQRLNHLQLRRRHLSTVEYQQERVLTVKRFNDEKINWKHNVGASN